MGILSGNPKNEPMHYGEVFGVWSYLSVSKGLLVSYQTLMNHAGDNDLKSLLTDMVGSIREEIGQIEELLKANGVGLPPTPPERPVANVDSIPVGARFMDMEIAAMIGANIFSGLVACSQIIGQCIREDVAMTFLQFHTNKAQYGLRVLRMSKEKGWLIPPPLHQKTPEPVHA